MNNIAIIPAKGDSKRIPRKNIKDFAGNPIISYPIKALSESGLFNKIVVVAGDKEVADTARQYGEVEIVNHPEVDSAFLAVRHALSKYTETNSSPDFVCCVYAITPFLESTYLRGGYDLIKNNTHEVVLGVTTYDFHVYRALRKEGDNIIPEFPTEITKKGQELTELVHDAGQFYWGKPKLFFDYKSAFQAEDVGAVYIPPEKVRDLDTPEDWRVAELMYSAISTRGDNG